MKCKIGQIYEIMMQKGELKREIVALIHECDISWFPYKVPTNLRAWNPKDVYKK